MVVIRVTKEGTEGSWRGVVECQGTADILKSTVGEYSRALEASADDALL